MDYTRQLDILNPQQFRCPITLIGCGGIGSVTACVLAKVGCPEFTIIDPDVLENHNICNQFFRRYDVGRPKVHALQSLLLELSESKIHSVRARFRRQARLSGIVISAVDSMKSRQGIWKAVLKKPDILLFIDGRLGGEVLEVFTVNPNLREDVAFYKDFLYPEDETAHLPCTARAIMYTGFVIAGFIVSQLKKWLQGEEICRRINFDLKTMTSVVQK